MTDTEKLVSELKNSYISSQLKNIYKIYLEKFDKKKYESGLADTYILRLIVKVFSDEILFKKFFDSLEKDISEVIYYLIWESETVTQA